MGLLGFSALTVAFLLVTLRGDFVSIDNLQSMALQMTEVGLLALALLAPMLTGGIDLSVVAIANLAAVVAGLLLNRPELPGWIGPVAALAVGACSGLANGLLITVLRLPPILATLGTMQVISGIAIILTKGHAVVGMPDWVGDLGLATAGLVPMPWLVFLAIALAVWILLGRTRFGFELKLLGSNAVAARYAGLPIPSIILRTYLLSGLCSALAGLMVLTRVNSASADYGASYLLLVVLINILGGVDTRGGSGSVVGVVLAVAVLQMLASGLELLSWTAFARDLLFGGLLIAVVATKAVGGLVLDPSRRFLKFSSGAVEPSGSGTPP